MKYPALEADLILQIYEQGGALMANDIEMYLKKKRNKSRFLPTSTIEKIKLSEVLGLLHKRSEGENNDSIIGMIWEACRFLSKFDYAPQDHRVEDFIESYAYPNNPRRQWKLRLATFYVTLYRWGLLASNDKYWWARL